MVGVVATAGDEMEAAAIVLVVVTVAVATAAVATAAVVATAVAAVAAVHARIRLHCWTLPSAAGPISPLSVPVGSPGSIGHKLARSHHRDRRFCRQFSG